MRIDIMTDIETLGTDSDSTIFQIAAMAFDIKTGERISDFNKISDISKNPSYEMKVTGSTLKWWLNTDKVLLAKLLNEGQGSSTELIEVFHKWLTGLSILGDVHLWGNGILFDNNMLRHQMQANNLTYPVNYKRDRDLRTIVDLACAKLDISEKELRERYYNPELEAHDAFNDVANQINIIVACYKELIGDVI